MYMSGFRDDEIMCKLVIPSQELKVYKSLIREKLLEAGFPTKG